MRKVPRARDCAGQEKSPAQARRQEKVMIGFSARRRAIMRMCAGQEKSPAHEAPGSSLSAVHG